MPTTTVQLTGDAIGGVQPELDHLRAMVAAGTPVEVKLGRKPPTQKQQLRPHFSTFWNEKAMATPPPAKVDWFTPAAPSIQRMYLNDTYGDCVIAGKGHAVGVTSANDKDSGGIVLATDQEILSQYHGICGAGDNGCVITDVLDVMQSRGFLAGGKYYKIDGYVPADWTNKLLTQVVIDLFGAPTIGINLPSAWTSASVWDVTNTGIVGGHDVTPVGYTDQGVQIASWGRIYTITWAAWQSTRWLEEFWVVLYQNWYGNDKLAPSGVDVAALQAALATIKGGGTPPIPDPNPTPVPPVPPTPPTHQVVTIPPTTTSFHNWLTGTVQIPIPGGTYAVTSAQAGEHGPVGFSFDLFFALFALYHDIQTADPQLKADFQALMAAIRNRTGILAALEKLAQDAIAVGTDPKILADLARIAADLGIPIPVGSVLEGK